MLAAVALAVAQLRDPVHRGVLLRALGVTLLLFAGLWWGCERLLAGIDIAGWPGWLADIWTGGGALVTSLLVLPLLLPLFAAIATGLAEAWLDPVVAAVEAKYYPDRTGRAPGLATALRLGAAATARLLLWNALALPFYIALLVTGIGTLALFIGLNGWLMGRSYLEIVAAHHLPPREIAAWISGHSATRWQVGLVTAALFAVPVVNLIAPLVGASVATHLFHRRQP